jgi:hypothetical protein
MPRPFAVLLLMLTAAPAAAQTFETVGARALGMGGAHVAVAEDPTAIWWNPAGLATGKPIFSASIEFARFESARDRSSFFLGAGAIPLGLSYVRTSESFATQGPADELVVRRLSTHQAGVTVLQSLTENVVAAATLKYVRGSADGQGGNAFTADVGLMAVAGLLKVGLTFRNVTSPGFETPDGARLELPWQARAGVAYDATPETTVAVDLDLRSSRFGLDLRRALAIGAERRLTRFAVRAGARFDTIGDVHPLGTVGGSYAVRNGMWVDVWAAAGSEAADRGWGVAGRFVY